MKIKYLGETSSFELTNGRIYDVISIEKGWYRVIPDMGDYPDADPPGYLYPPELFEIVEEASDETSRR